MLQQAGSWEAFDREFDDTQWTDGWLQVPIAQVPPGLALTPPDGQPIRLVFLLVSPEGDAEGHLATLGEIARLVTPHELRQRLLHARTATDVLELVRGALQGAGG